MPFRRNRFLRPRRHAFFRQEAKPGLDQARFALKGFLQLGMQARAASFFGHITQAFAMDGVGEAVDWIDRQIAECVYCGSVIRVQV